MRQLRTVVLYAFYYFLFCTQLTLVADATKSTIINKPHPDKILQLLKEGNKRFYTGKSKYPNTDIVRLKQAERESQKHHAYATVLSCSDSRVPVELIFDAGVMDIFVVRVAGNVCDTDSIGSIEYGLLHVYTPVLVILGHTQCGAVTTVIHAIDGKINALEPNIPPLIDNIVPAVKRAKEKHKNIHYDKLIAYAIEENVWQSIEHLFMKSRPVRDIVKEGKVKVIGGIYEVGTGKIRWLPVEKVDQILQEVEAGSQKDMSTHEHLTY